MSRLPIILFFVIILILPIGCSKKSDKKPIYKKRSVYVKVEKVRRGLLSRTLTYKGTVLPWQKANIGPDVSGRVKKIYKKPGDKVKKDTLLAELDTTTLKLQLKQAEAAHEVSKAAYKDALLNYQRLNKLYEKRAISRLQLEKSELTLESADTQKKSAEAGLNVVKHILENSYMRAPFNGIITSKNLNEGDIINPMMGMNTGVLILMDLRKVKITLDIPSEDIEKVKIGQKCKIKVDTLPGEVFKGEVYSKNLAADIISKTFKVEVKIDNPATKIKAGIFAEVMIEISRKENILILPLSALIVQDDVRYVVLYNNGISKFKNVKVGERNDRVFEILGGLEEDQLVVVEGNYDLKEENPITIKKNE